MCAPPYASDLDIAANHYTFSVLYIVEELSDVDTTIRVDFLTVLVAYSVIENTYDLCIFSYVIVATKASHLRVMKFSRILVSIAEICNGLALKESEAEFSLEDSIRVVEDSVTMHLASLEFSFIEELRIGGPPKFSLPMVLAILKLTVIGVSIAPGDLTLAMEDVSNKLAFIDRFSWRKLGINFGV